MIYLRVPRREDAEARLISTATTGLEERAEDYLAYFASRADAEAALEILADLRPELIEAPDQNWQAEWQSHWKSFTLGERFFLAPEWDDTPTPGGRIRLRMHSGMAFGSGDHATTQMALLALEKHLRPGHRVLDLGTGSGILLIAAARLGANIGVGTDNDPVAIGLAQQNLRGEGLAAELVLTESVSFADASFDVVLNNISPRFAVEFVGETKRLLRPDGLALVGGFGDEHADEVTKTYRDAGLDVVSCETRAEWRMLVTRRQLGS